MTTMTHLIERGSVDGVVLALEVVGERVVFRSRVGFPGRGVSVEFLARP